MKKIAPGIGIRAKSYRKPKDNLVGGGRKIRKRKTIRKPRRLKNGRKRNKPKTK